MVECDSAENELFGESLERDSSFVMFTLPWERRVSDWN